MLAPAWSRPRSSVLQRRRDIAADDPQGEPLDHGGLPDAGLTGQDGVVLPAAHQDVDDLADLLVAPDDGIDLAGPRVLRQVHRELL